MLLLTPQSYLWLNDLIMELGFLDNSTLLVQVAMKRITGGKQQIFHMRHVNLIDRVVLFLLWANG